MGSLFNSGLAPCKVDTDEEEEYRWIESWIKKTQTLIFISQEARLLRPSCKVLVRMTHVWSFLQPTVHCLLVWQCKMTVRAMMRWFLWRLHRFCRAEACHRAERDKRKGAKSEKTMFGVIPSPEPDVVLALLFYPLQRKHSDPDNLRSGVRRQTLARCVKVCVVIECQNWVTLPLKMCITSFSCWAETEPDVELFFLSPQN